MPYEGQTGTAPDGTRVIYRGGKVYPLGQEPAAKSVGYDTTEDRKRLVGLRDRADKSLYAATQAEQFVDLNRKTGTGGINGLGFPWKGGGTIGDVLAMNNDNLAQMKSITSRVAPQNRVTGSGSSSDKDVDMMVSGFPNINMPGNANARNGVEWKSQAAYDAAKRAFADKYFSVHGSLLGADDAFGQYWKERGSKRYGVEALTPKPAPKADAAPDVYIGKHGKVRPVR